MKNGWLLLLGCVLGSAWAGPARGEQWEDAEVLVPIIYIVHGDAGSVGVMLLGTDQGAVKGERLLLYRPDQEKGLTEIGQVRVDSLTAEFAVGWLRVGDAVDSAVVGDLVQMRVRVPTSVSERLTWDLAAKGITYTNVDNDTVFLSAAILRNPAAMTDSVFLAASAALVAECTSRLEDNEAALAMIDTGRFKGLRILDAMKAATPRDLHAYFQYVLSYPGKYSGQTYRLEESFAGWASSGGPLSALEAIERASPLDDEGVKQFIAPFHDVFLEELPIENWYTLSREAWLAGKHEESREILRIMRLASEVMGSMKWWFYYWTAGADIESWAGNTDEALLFTTNAMTALETDSTNMGTLHHNRGTIYEARSEWEEALQDFQTALGWKGALVDSFVVDGASSWQGVGRCLYKLQRYEEAAHAFHIAAQVYEADGSLDALERLATTYSDLGDVYKSMGRYGLAIDAWRRGRDVAERLGWKGTMAAALVDVSDGHWNLGDYRDAVAARERAMGLYAETGDTSSIAIALTNLGELHWLLSEVDTARACFEEARHIHARLGETWDLADVYFREGANERLRGDHPAALRRLTEAERLFTQVEDSAAVANTRLQMAEACEGLSRRAQADSLYTLSRDAYRRLEKRGDEARVLEWWGSTLLARKLPREARRRIEESLALREQIDDLAGLTDGLRSLSDILAYQEGNKDSARAAAERALAIAEEMPSKPKIAEACLTVGYRYSDLGLLTESLAQQRRALALFEEIEDLKGTARAHNALGALLESRGDDAGARREYEVALALADSADAPGLEAGVLGSMAWQLYIQGRAAPAESLAHAALAIQEELGNEWASAYLYNTLASCAEVLGRFDEAQALHAKALAIRESWSDLFGQSASHNNIGSSLMRVRDYAGAVPHLERALELGEQIGYHVAITVSVANLAECYVELGRGEEALALMERSLGLARGAGAMSLVADDYILRGKLERKLGRFPDARRDLEAGLAVADSLGKTLSILTARHELGALAWAEGKPEEAVTTLEGVITDLETFRNPVLLWEPLLYLGRARRDAHKPEPAVEAYRRSLETLEDFRRGIADEGQSEQFQARHGDVYRELMDLLLKQGWSEEAQQVLGLMKSQELRDMQTVPLSERASGEAQEAATRVEGLKSRETALAQKLRDELNRPKTEQRGELIAVWQAQIDSLKLAFHDYVETLRREKPELYERLEVSPVSFKKLQAGLREGEAFVEPLLLPDRVVMFVVRHGSDPLVFRESAVTETRMHELIREMRERLAQPTLAWESRTAALAVDPGSLDPGTANLEDPTEPARSLDSLLIAPIRSDLEGITTLIVSPGGPLRYIPFAALYDGAEFLLDRFELVVLTQAGTLEERAPLTADASMLAFGNPDGSLGGAESEVKALAEMWRPAKVADFYGATATKALLREQVEQCRILHLATHGVLLPDNPEGSYLLLAGSDAVSHLTLRDIVVLPLTGVDLTVLSACQTAMGEKGEGREISGLAYTFEQTGAGCVVASLWNVNDRSTAELMKAFYRNLREGGMTKAKALRDAQLVVRRTPEFAHPYFWAPFILIGNWR